MFLVSLYLTLLIEVYEKTELIWAGSYPFIHGKCDTSAVIWEFCKHISDKIGRCCHDTCHTNFSTDYDHKISTNFHGAVFLALGEALGVRTLGANQGETDPHLGGEDPQDDPQGDPKGDL